MNGTSGFQEVRSSIFRSSSSHFLHEQRHQCGAGAWHLLRTHNLIALSTGISTKRENVPVRAQNSSAAPISSWAQEPKSYTWNSTN